MITLVLTLTRLNAQENKYDWLLIYYMPYDNNLSTLSTNILNQFKNASLTERICITLQMDRAGDGGMTRYSFTSKLDSTHLEDENSGSQSGLTNYFRWVSERFKAQHYAIILLNHGGLVDEYGLDEFPKEKWIHVGEIASAIQEFNTNVGISSIDLLFEQVCTRATIENLYEFRAISNFTLASQSLVPAPGYYYSSLFKTLERGGIQSGDQLADSIVHFERSDMYYSYSLINNSKWNQWISLMDNYSRTIENKNIKFSVDGIKTLSYWKDFYWDFITTLQTVKVNGAVPGAAQQLASFTSAHLLKRLYQNNNTEEMQGYSGISMLSPFRTHRSINLSIFELRPFQSYLNSLRASRKK